MVDREQKGNSVYIVSEVVMDATGAALLGASVLLSILRLSDRKWLDWDDLTYKSSGWSGSGSGRQQAMTELDSAQTESEGVYYYQYTLPNADEEYLPFIYCAAAGDPVQQLDIIVGGYVDSLPPRLRKNTALNNFMIFMKDANGDGVTELTISAQRSIDGAAFAAMTNDPPTEISGGWYKINFSQADTNGDVVAYQFTATGARPIAFTVTMQQEA
jgi:hypothetical protein